MNEEDDIDLETLEIDLLLEAIFRKYEYDFREYANASMHRKILHRLRLSGYSHILEMTHQVLTDPAFFAQLLQDFYTTVTEMFRDPPFYLIFREKALPLLRHYPFFKIWVAGCATGEEAYSIAILLKEADLYDRCQIYATDLNKESIAIAKEGIYPISSMQTYTANYQKSGGSENFSDYYTANYQHVILNSSLKKNILFSTHNLAMDDVFNEFHLISCRNVLIYFNHALQNRVLQLFLGSLSRQGLLCLGSKESLRFSDHADQFKIIDQEQRLYQKV